MEQIASFTIDHNRLQPGMYLARRDGDIVTLDLRFKKPNMGDLLSNSELHSTVFPLSHKSSVTSPPSLNTGKFKPIRFSGYSDSSFL